MRSARLITERLLVVSELTAVIPVSRRRVFNNGLSIPLQSWNKGG